jgi:hypothetical protein
MRALFISSLSPVKVGCDNADRHNYGATIPGVQTKVNYLTREGAIILQLADIVALNYSIPDVNSGVSGSNR